MATNTPIGQGKVITADQFNELITVYNTHWSDDIPSVTFNDLTSDTSDAHSRGWGMSTVVPPLVDCNTIIRANHINELIAQVNAGSLHRDNDPYVPFDLYSMYSKNAVIYATVYSLLKSYMDNLKTNDTVNLGTSFPSQDSEFNIYDINEQPRFLLNPEYAYLSSNELSITNNPTWNSGENDNKIYTEFKTSFSDYQQGRYFFNAGGKIIVELDSVGGYGTNYWDYILDGLGQIRIGATNVLLPNAGVNITPTSLGGIYDMNNNGIGQWTEVFTATGKTAGEYGYGEYGGTEYYGVGEYATRTVKIFVRGDENSDGGFDIYTKIVLSDNIEIFKLLSQDFTAIVGYLQPLDAPEDSWMTDSRGDPFRVYDTDCDPNVDPVVSSEYQFLEREAPTLSLVSNWQIDT